MHSKVEIEKKINALLILISSLGGLILFILHGLMFFVFVVTVLFLVIYKIMDINKALVKICIIIILLKSLIILLIFLICCIKNFNIIPLPGYNFYDFGIEGLHSAYYYKSDIFKDADFISTWGKIWAEIWNLNPVNGFIQYLSHKMEYGGSGFIGILAFYYYLFGYSPITGKFINVLLSILTGILIYFITRKIFGYKSAIIASSLVLFYPSLFLWSVTNLKDTSVIFFEALCLWALVSFLQSRNYLYFIPLIVSIWGIAKIRHSGIAYLILIIISVVLFLSLNISFRKKAIITIFICLIAVIVNPMRLRILNKYESFKSSVIGMHKGHINTEGYTYKFLDEKFYYGAGGSEMSVVNLGKSSVKAAFYYLTVPFPFSHQSKQMILATPIMMGWYLLLLFALIGCLWCLRYKWKESFPIIFFILSLTIIVSLFEGNIGTTFRHRDMVTPFYLIFSSVGIINLFRVSSKPINIVQ